MEFLAGAGLVPLPSRSVDRSDTSVTSTTNANNLYPILNESSHDDNATVAEMVKLTAYPTLVELKSMIDEQRPDALAAIQPPSIEPLREFILKRTATIEGLRDLRTRMAKHILSCKISNTVGNSASIIGGILCFVFPPVGVPVLLAGSATSLGMFSD